jgi:hypothetical protein
MSAALITSATGRYSTHCKLCRKRVAEAPALDVPIIGQPGKRAEDLMGVLLKHLTRHHPTELQTGASLFAEFQPFLILSAFEYEDPTITPRLELIRAAIFAQVQKNSMTDAALQQIVDRLGLSADDCLKVYGAMQTVRDACCEFGQFAPKVPPAESLPATR